MHRFAKGFEKENDSGKVFRTKWKTRLCEKEARGSQGWFEVREIWFEFSWNLELIKTNSFQLSFKSKTEVQGSSANFASNMKRI